MSRIGVHVKTGSRNGYGPVCEAKPAIVFSVGEGGALQEAKEKSGGHTITIFRDIKYYGDNPNLGNMTVKQAIDTADAIYPHLAGQWRLNPADYYAPLNETGGNDPRAIQVANAYEMRIMEHAEADGFKLCVCNLFSGTPDDGSVAGQNPNGGLETWAQLYGDHIARAYDGGHVYGRHVYGFPLLVPLDFNSDRPFREAEWLDKHGLCGGIVISELGLHGGMSKGSDEEVISQMAQYDVLMRSGRVNQIYIVGGAWWTYGAWHGVNIESESSQIVAYLLANPSTAWTEPECEPPPEQETVEKWVWDLTLSEQENCGIRLNEAAGLEAAIRADGLIPVISETRGTYKDRVLTVQAGEDLAHTRPRKAYVYEPGKPIYSFPDPYVGSPGFELGMWPAETYNVTQYFGENPDWYKDYCDANGLCLPGHNGIDIAAPNLTEFRAAVGGQVTWASDQKPSGGPSDYGWHVRIQTGDYLIIYAHMAPNPPVMVGQVVGTGQVLGYSGNTGNSTGPHLHFEMRKCPGAPGWPWCIIDPWPYLEPLYRPPISPTIDMKPYFRPIDSGVGKFFVLQHGDGPTEDIQLQVQGENIFVVKNRQYERMRLTDYVERREDTSRGNNTLYTLDDGFGWSRWCPRFWAVGDSFYRNPTVTVMDKNCNVLKQDKDIGSWLTFEALHEHWVSPGSDANPNGLAFPNVIELAFRWHPDGGWLERYWLAPGLGPYVQWMSTDGGHSWVSEIPQGRPPLQREVIHCLG